MDTSENIRKTRLQKLTGSDFEMLDGEPDIRGWDVKDAAGKQLGEVEELIFDYESRKVRYLVVDLEDNDYELDDKQVLVPIGIAELHESDDDVILTAVTPAQLNALPEYNEDRFDTEHEVSVRNVFGGLGGAALNGEGPLENKEANQTVVDDDFYNHEHFNDQNLYRNRDHMAELKSTTDPFQTEGQLNLEQWETGVDPLDPRNTTETTSDNSETNTEKDIDDDDNPDKVGYDRDRIPIR